MPSTFIIILGVPHQEIIAVQPNVEAIYLIFQYEVPVARDPNRLLRPTEGWKSRTKEVGASAESGRVYTMSHRCVISLYPPLISIAHFEQNRTTML